MENIIKALKAINSLFTISFSLYGFNQKLKVNIFAHLILHKLALNYLIMQINNYSVIIDDHDSPPKTRKKYKYLILLVDGSDFGKPTPSSGYTRLWMMMEFLLVK